MNWKKITIIFIAAVFVTSVVYDFLAISQGGVESSISHTIILWSYRFPAFTFSFGFLCGHLFWRMGDTKETTELKK